MFLLRQLFNKNQSLLFLRSSVSSIGVGVNFSGSIVLYPARVSLQAVFYFYQQSHFFAPRHKRLFYFFATPFVRTKGVAPQKRLALLESQQ
jgi:hypothetical protein